jgi:methylthioribose-1-phosphate isomerase
MAADTEAAGADPANPPVAEWQGDRLVVLDQTVLPGEVRLLELRTATDVANAIRRLAVRGAPLIGVCGAFGVVLGLQAGEPLDRVIDLLGGARPTAVNLRWAVERVAAAARTVTDAADAETVAAAAEREALRVQEEDRESCRRIAAAGQAELSGRTRLMTHCNAGRLATAGIGTALAPIYAKALAGEPVSVLATETRPLLQGARLTAWELAVAGVPVTLVPDTAAGAALAAGRVDAVIVGCDRVAGNGDTANKIGTYSLAVLARENGVPFYVAGPLSSFDAVTADGGDIVIEERAAAEVRQVGAVTTAPEVPVWNPAFDVTPARYITAFITDVGVLRPPYAASIAAALHRDAES